MLHDILLWELQGSLRLELDLGKICYSSSGYRIFYVEFFFMFSSIKMCTTETEKETSAFTLTWNERVINYVFLKEKT